MVLVGVSGVLLGVFGVYVLCGYLDVLVMGWW